MLPDVRLATAQDNDALLALAERCPMKGDIGLCITRRPDFFALNRLEGQRWKVGVVDGPDGRPIGSVAVAERDVHLDGAPTPTMYVSDLKVDPAHRGTGAADALITWARDECVAAQGPDVLMFVTVLAGNTAMQRRMVGASGMPHLHHFATLRSYSVSLLWRRRVAMPDGLRVTRAEPADLGEMADLWARVAPHRQFSAVHDHGSLAAWIEAAPQLDVSSYWLARRRDGHLAGFFGLWDQEAFKQTQVTSYSPKLAAVRALFNVAAPLVGATPLPAAGESLRYLTAVNICVPGETPDVLRSLVVHAYNELRGRGYSFLTLGLDRTDPLTASMSGLLAQPTDVWACMGTVQGPYSGPDLSTRPVHHEIALV